MKLNQVLAIEKGEKNRAHAAISALHKRAQKVELYNGFVKTYQKADDEGEDQAQQRHIVQLRADGVLRSVTDALAELFDIEATKNFANQDARADVVVDGTPLIKAVPVTFLLFLEKQLNDLRTFVSKMPTLDTADTWAEDTNSLTFKTAPIVTQRTKKNVKVIVKYEATKEHPAQTEMISVDEVAGHWSTIKESGALPGARRVDLLARIDTLANAVKIARETANDSDCTKRKVAAPIFGYLFR